jgi:hypothetical protein
VYYLPPILWFGCGVIGAWIYETKGPERWKGFLIGLLGILGLLIALSARRRVGIYMCRERLAELRPHLSVGGTCPRRFSSPLFDVGASPEVVRWS